MLQYRKARWCAAITLIVIAVAEAGLWILKMQSFVKTLTLCILVGCGAFITLALIFFDDKKKERKFTDEKSGYKVNNR